MKNRPNLTIEQKQEILNEWEYNWDVNNLEIAQDFAITNEFIYRRNDENYDMLRDMGFTNHLTMCMLDKINLHIVVSHPTLETVETEDFGVKMNNHFGEDIASKFTPSKNLNYNGNQFHNINSVDDYVVKSIFNASSLVHTMYGNFARTIVVNKQLSAILKQSKFFIGEPINEESKLQHSPDLLGVLSDGTREISIVVNPNLEWSDKTIVMTDNDFKFESVEMPEGITSVSFVVHNALENWEPQS